MIKPSQIKPDIELRDLLQGRVTVVRSAGKTEPVTVYSDWERPTNKLPDDFIVIYINGNVSGVGSRVDFAQGYLMVSLYCKLNDDGSVKKSRVAKLLEQFEELVDKAKTEHYFYELEMERYITPTTPNQTSGYSTTTLNLRWHTTTNFNVI